MILYIFILILFVISIVCIFGGLYFFKKKSLIDSIPTSKIRSIAMGLVEISGKVVPYKNDGVFKSPFTKQDCVYYRYTIEEYRKSGKHSHWVTVKRGEEIKKFFLKDETGQVLINPDHADIKIKRSAEYNSRMGRDPPDAVKQFLNRVDVDFEGIIFGINKTMRYREYIIRPNDKLYIMGTADDNIYVKEASADKGVDDVMICKGINEKFFLISDKPEKILSRNYLAISMLFFIIGAGLLVYLIILVLSMVI